MTSGGVKQRGLTGALLDSFETVLGQFGRKRVLVVGDIMLDRFVYGHVSRISPEAPAPVIETAGPLDVVGGSRNFLRHTASLGAASVIACATRRHTAAPSLWPPLQPMKGP